MADTEKKISELDSAAQINTDDITVLSQGNSGTGFASVKATILAIANKIVSEINFSSALQTTDKTITGAINEAAQGGGGGSSSLAGLNDVDIDDQTLVDDQVLVWDSTEEKWVNADQSGQGGTTVVANPSGTPTDDLETIQIGNVIYGIVGGGGGDNFSTTPLFTASTDVENITLSDSIENYDAITIIAGYTDGGGHQRYTATYYSDTLMDNAGENVNFGVTNDSTQVHFKVTDSTHLVRTHRNTLTIEEIMGVTYGGSGGSGGSEITDYEGTLTAGQTSLTIAGPKINNSKVIDIYTSAFGVGPTNAVVSNGSITLTFNAQQSDLDVLISVRDKGIAPIPFDIDLNNFVTNKVWYYYDSNKSAVPTSLGEGIILSGSDYANDWTTSSCIGIDLNEYTIPVNLSKIKVHFKNLVTTGYAGACLFTHTTKFEGTTNGTDTNLKQPRLPIESGVYIKEDETNGLNLSDYTLEIPCTESALSRYLYIMLLDGVQPSWNGSTNTYNNALNGGYTAIIDGIWFE